MKRTTPNEMTTTVDHSMEIFAIDVQSIVVPERKRETAEKDIETIATSMQEVGHLVPITIRFVASEDNTGNEQLIPTLITGAHRLAAVKKLGWPTIDCMTLEDDRVTAELAEIAENLHRIDLTKDQRDEQIRSYAALLEQQESQSGQNVPIESKREDGRGHRRKGMGAIVAEKTGLSKKTVYRALKAKTAETAEPKKPKAKTKAKPEPKTTSKTARTHLQEAWEKADESDREWFLEWATQP